MQKAPAVRRVLKIIVFARPNHATLVAKAGEKSSEHRGMAARMIPMRVVPSPLLLASVG